MNRRFTCVAATVAFLHIAGGVAPKPSILDLNFLRNCTIEELCTTYNPSLVASKSINLDQCDEFQSILQ